MPSVMRMQPFRRCAVARGRYTGRFAGQSIAQDTLGRSYATKTNAQEYLRSSNARNEYVRLDNRACLEIEGPEAIKFLQGLTTNQMLNIERGGDGVLAAFLSPQGRVLFDAFIYPKNVNQTFPHPAFLVESAEASLPGLHAHLKRFLLRTKAKITPQSDWRVWQAWGPQSKQLWGGTFVPKSGSSTPAGSVLAKNSFVDNGLKDCRHPEFGVRFLMKGDAVPPLPPNFIQVAPEEYKIRRLLAGIPEGPDDFFHAASLPLESNFDYMHGVDFRKGCYLGQELTIRTYHTGVTRKRIVPVQLYTDTESAPDQQSIDTEFNVPLPTTGSDIVLVGDSESKPTRRKASSGGTSVGKFCSGIHNVGLALLRLDHVGALKDGQELVCENGLKLKAYVPEWWPAPIGEQS
ncbi:uncharacterized protein BJ171DRAFT_492338 [Polychytrium aggregatum]|uniref:uncharacterized protein n=1 Tax=Polychytrium aggregatum TaxID=110093 RepID=UPI0022FDCDD5|nr:uncharacterized protein BJ171DRAFT_492338 [Polychytrium aggregatum]KAI9208005.1 hypothetical protein BJ171DRAFT_492338 [Polychytrium aggregatum]